MKQRNIIIVSLAALAATAWATKTFAQDTNIDATVDANADATVGATVDTSVDADVAASVDTQGYQFNRDNVLNPILNTSDRLLDRAVNHLDQLPEDVQADVTALQEALQALKDSWNNDYRPGVGATLEEIKAARQQFLADMSEQIEAAKQLRMEVVVELRNQIRAEVGHKQWSDETKELYQQYREIKTQLSTQWKAVVAGLGDNATREDVAAAREQFQADNADLIAQEKELALQLRTQIRTEAKAHATERSSIADREPMAPELQALRDQIAAAREQLRAQKQTLREELAGLTPEERETRRQEILEQLKESHNQLKEQRRQLIEDLRNGQDGDRRADD